MTPEPISFIFRAYSRCFLIRNFDIPNITGAEAKASSDIDWKPFLPTYHFSVADRQAQREKHRASRTFTFVALVIIVAQLALLAFIIHKAMRYLPPLFDTTLTN